MGKDPDRMFEKIVVRVRKKLLGLVEVKGVILSSKPYVEEIEKFRKLPNVRAIIVRIDSPGGAVAPSQEIYEAVQRAREKKPVYASMGSVAASGGYYIASAAEKIYANPGTLTGSIGVAMHMRNVQGLLSKIGVDNSIIKSGEYKDAGSPYRKMTPKESRYLQAVSDDIYDQFLEAVAEGRKIDREQAEELAQGKIYTGKKAMELGLVDALGGLGTAIRETGRSVGIPDEPNVVSFKRKRRFLGEGLVQAAVKQLLYIESTRETSLEGFMLLAPLRGA
jgi:protease-4